MGDKRKIINYDGSVSSCVEVNDLNHEAKDYFMVDDLTTETLVKNNPISDANDDCKVCFMKYNCAGGCPSRNYHVSGDIYKPDPYRCYVVKHVVPKIIERM
ncbi:SPASM domain-containing protein [Vibrio aerogenes]